MSSKSIFDKEYFTEYYHAMTGSFSMNDLDRNMNWFYGWFNALNDLYDFRSGNDRSVLEIGCAIGAASRILAERGFKVTATDISKHAITKSKAINKHPNLDFQVLDIQSTRKYKKKFDVIFAFEVIEHLEDYKSALKNMRRMLKPEGIIICSTPYPFGYVFRDKTHINVRHPFDWIRIFNEAGFSKVKTKYLSFVPFFYRFSKLFHLTLPVLFPIPYINSTIFIYAQK